MRGAHWQNLILLSILTFLLAGPAWGGGMPDSGKGIYTDYGSFLGEYQNAGALKFYDNTEEMLRLAQFETALMRYRFLKGKIQRKVDYRGLLAMVDLRLRFLKKQMHLTNQDIAPIPPRRAWIPQNKPPTPKPAAKKDAAAKPKAPAAAVKDNNKKRGALTIPGQVPPVYVITGPPPGAAKPPATTAPPVTAAKKLPPVVTTTPKTQEEKAEEAAEEAKPPKPLSVWDKLKLRLHLK